MSGHFYFEIQVEDLQRAADFYSSIFEWKFERAGEDIPIEYWRIVTGGMRGGMLKRPVPAPPPGHGTNAFVCSIEVREFEEAAVKILEAGGTVALPKFAVPGVCWQGYFLDTEGNTFGVFQVDENAR